MKRKILFSSSSFSRGEEIGMVIANGSKPSRSDFQCLSTEVAVMLAITSKITKYTQPLKGPLVDASFRPRMIKWLGPLSPTRKLLSNWTRYHHSQPVWNGNPRSSEDTSSRGEFASACFGVLRQVPSLATCGFNVVLRNHQLILKENQRIMWQHAPEGELSGTCFGVLKQVPCPLWHCAIPSAVTFPIAIVAGYAHTCWMWALGPAIHLDAGPPPRQRVDREP